MVYNLELGNPILGMISGECELTGSFGCDLQTFSRWNRFSALWYWVQGRLYVPKTLPLEWSQCHRAAQEVETVSRVLASWVLEQLCFQELLSSGLAVATDSCAWEAKFKQRQFSVSVQAWSRLGLNPVFVSALDRTEGSGLLLRMPAAHGLISVAKAGSVLYKWRPGSPVDAFGGLRKIF